MGRPRALVLFGGVGGATRGLTHAGFDTVSVEWEHDEVAVARAAGYRVVRGDVRHPLVPTLVDGPGWLLWSSFPCQAFSTAGKRLGAEDARNGWPWTVAVLDAMISDGNRPRAFAGENVTGLTMHKKAAGCGAGADPKPSACPRCYLDHVILPDLRARFAWVDWRITDAADHGVPQRRKRVFILAADEPVAWTAPTHSGAALMRVQADGSYWRRHGLEPRGVAAKIRPSEQGDPGLLPWRTVRDALAPIWRGQEWYLRAENVGAVARPPDEPAMTQTAKALTYAYAEDVGARREGDFSRGEIKVRNGALTGKMRGGVPYTEEYVTTGDAPSPTVRSNLAPEVDLLRVFNGQNSQVGPVVARRTVEHESPPDAPAPTVRGIGKPPEVELAVVSAGKGAVAYLAAAEPHRLDTPAPTVTTTEVKGTRGENMGRTLPNGVVTGGPDRASDALWLATGRRRLTPVECAVLCDLPADYPLGAARTTTARYRMVGNIACPAQVEAVGVALRPLFR